MTPAPLRAHSQRGGSFCAAGCFVALRLFLPYYMDPRCTPPIIPANIARPPLFRDGREWFLTRRGGACPARRRIARLPRFRNCNKRTLICRGRIAGHPRGPSGPQEHCDTTLFRDGRGRSLIRRGRIAGHPCGPSGPRRIARAPCSAMDGGRGMPRPYEWGRFGQKKIPLLG